MNTMQKEDTVQAVLIADSYDKTLQPFVNEGSTVSILHLYSIYSNDARALHDANND